MNDEHDVATQTEQERQAAWLARPLLIFKLGCGHSLEVKQARTAERVKAQAEWFARPESACDCCYLKRLGHGASPLGCSHLESKPT